MFFNKNSAEKNRQLANEFIAKNQSLLADMTGIKENIENLQSRKQSILSLIKLQMQQSRITKSIAVPHIAGLEKLLRIEERYLGLIYGKLTPFIREVSSLKKDCKRLTFRSVKKFVDLSGEYITTLLYILKELSKILKHAIEINYKQHSYVKGSQRKIAKGKLPSNFIGKFYSYQITAEKAQKLIRDLQEAQKSMSVCQSRVIEAYHASKKEIEWLGKAAGILTVIVLIVGNLLINDWITLGVSFSVLYLMKNPEIVRE